MTKTKAEQALATSICDCFLIRKTKGARLFLSLIHDKQFHHIKIKYGPGWYELEGGSANYCFSELDDLITHYSNKTISDDLNITLGRICADNYNGPL